MRVGLYAAAVIGAVALAASSAAWAKKLPPSACVFHRHLVADGTFCSFDCDPKFGNCSQQYCDKGKFAPVIGCLAPFCSQRCG